MASQDLQTIAFPTLDEAHMATLARCTHAAVERCEAGQTLIQVGDRDFRFFVIKSGEVEIVDRSGESPETVVVHRPGQFTGDVAHLTGAPSIISAVARTECEVYAVSNAALRELLNGCPDLSDVILQAFIARRQLLRESGKFTG